MKGICRIFVTSMALTVLLVGLSGCRRAGPAERAGKKIDQTVEKAGQQVEKAGQKIDTAIKTIRNRFTTSCAISPNPMPV